MLCKVYSVYTCTTVPKLTQVLLYVPLSLSVSPSVSLSPPVLSYEALVAIHRGLHNPSSPGLINVVPYGPLVVMRGAAEAGGGRLVQLPGDLGFVEAMTSTSKVGKSPKSEMGARIRAGGCIR